MEETKKEALPFKEPAPKLKTTVVLRPAFLDEYIEASKNESIWKKKKEALRPETLEFLKKQAFDDIFWKTSKKNPKYDPVGLYEFLLDKVPHKVLEAATIKQLDLSKLDELYIAGYFDIHNLPECCYEKGGTTDLIEIPANRKRKKEE